MNRLAYNLARSPQVDRLRFTLRAALLFLLALLLGILAATNLAGRSGQARRDIVEAGAGRSRLQALAAESGRLRREIEAWKKSRGGQLAQANSLIASKSFSFVSRLDFLENASSPGIRVRNLALENKRGARIRVSISARSLPELFALYKKLAAYELAIASETQTQDEYLVNLSFRMPDEGI
jgi:hypothetical protein